MTGRSGCVIAANMLERIEGGRLVDVLAEIFETVHVENAQLTQVDLRGAKRLEFEPSKAVELGIVLIGRVAVSVGEETVVVNEGEVFCIPKGGAFGLSCETGKRHSSVELAEDNDARLLRGQCRVSEPEKNPLIGVLPHLITVPNSKHSNDRWVASLVDVLLGELGGNEPGASSIIVRVVELLFVQLVRVYVASTETPAHGWLRALSDPQIGVALGMIHEKPAQVFTVAGLAHAVGMSRSAFASQFTRLVGEPPLHYVARWRMLKAGLLLKDRKSSLVEIAGTVGYESEAAFSKAFKRWSGQSPGCYRRAQRERDQSPSVASQALSG